MIAVLGDIEGFQIKNEHIWPIITLKRGLCNEGMDPYTVSSPAGTWSTCVQALGTAYYLTQLAQDCSKALLPPPQNTKPSQRSSDHCIAGGSGGDCVWQGSSSSGSSSSFRNDGHS